jgi:DtxR family Mn-dependent transcriptional regulator
MRLSAAAEDCLLLVHRMQEREEAASTSRLSRALGVADSTVTAMVQKLSKLHLLRRDKRLVALTVKGETLARQLIRRHRLIESYLHEFLGYNWEDVHAEAERLEHAVSPRFVEAISEQLGHPVFDPHGNPIPDAKGNVQSRRLARLSDVPAGTRGRVAQVLTESPDVLVYLSELGIELGSKVRVMAAPEHDTIVQLRLGKNDIVLGQQIASQVLIEPT